MPQQVNRSIIVKGNVGEIYDIWSDFENFPNFMEPIKSIEKTGDGVSHWIVEGPFGTTIEWDAKTTMKEKNKRIAWNSINGDIKTTGQVTFTELPKDQTQVNVTLQYSRGSGVAPPIFENLFGNTEKQLIESLRKFKSYAEENLN